MHTAIGEQDKEKSSVNVWTVGNTEQIIQPSLSYPDNKEKTVGQNTEISQSEYDVNPIAPKSILIFFNCHLKKKPYSFLK